MSTNFDGIYDNIQNFLVKCKKTEQSYDFIIKYLLDNLMKKTEIINQFPTIINQGISNSLGKTSNELSTKIDQIEQILHEKNDQIVQLQFEKTILQTELTRNSKLLINLSSIGNTLRNIVENNDNIQIIREEFTKYFSVHMENEDIFL